MSSGTCRSRASTFFARRTPGWLSRNNRRVNAKSIMGVMMLAAGVGSVIEIEADGADEHEAMAALRALIDNKFGEGE